MLKYGKCRETIPYMDAKGFKPGQFLRSRELHAQKSHQIRGGQRAFQMPLGTTKDFGCFGGGLNQGPIQKHSQ